MSMKVIKKVIIFDKKYKIIKKIFYIGNVEKWLLEIEEMMKVTLQDITKRSLMDSQARTKWVRSW